MQNSLRGAVECEFRGEKHTLRFTQGSFLWLEEENDITFEMVRECLGNAVVPWKQVPVYIAAGLLHEDGMSVEKAREMVKDSLHADLQADLFSALIFALNGAEEKKVARMKEALKLVSRDDLPDDGTGSS